MANVPSPYQVAIYKAVRRGKKNLLVKAVAGAGKTTTTLGALDYVGEGASVCMLAFNKPIADEMASRIRDLNRERADAGEAPVNATGRTINSEGAGAVRRAGLGNGQVDGKKLWTLVRSVVPFAQKKYSSSVVALVKAARTHGMVPFGIEKELDQAGLPEAKGLIPDTVEQWRALASRYDIEISSPRPVEIDYARELLKKALLVVKAHIDFDDQIYLPIVFDLPMEKYDWAFVDECFPAGTLVETEEGPVPIEDIVDKKTTARVMSCSHEGALVPSLVTAGYRSPVVNPLITIEHEHGRITTTTNHPFWVSGRGWIAAGALEEGDTLCSLRETNSGDSSDMLTFVQSEAKCDEEGSLSGSRTSPEDLGANACRSNRDSKSDGTAGHTGQSVGSASEDGPLASCPGWKRDRSDRGGGTPARGVVEAFIGTMDPRACHRVWSASRGSEASSATEFVQTGHRAHQDEGGGRRGRKFASPPVEAGARPEEGRTFALSRVVRISYSERGSEGRRREGSAEDSVDVVYTLGVEGGNYVANGILVKNCQDLNDANLVMIEKMAKKFMFVGDESQSLYAFRGADADAMQRIREKFNCDVLPLSITYRCPLSVVRAAQVYDPAIEARPGAPEGEVANKGSARTADFKVGDMVVCRYNAPLIQLAFVLVKRNIPILLRGTDVVSGVMDTITAIGATSIESLLNRIGPWSTKQVQRFLAADDEAKAVNVMDRVSMILTVVTESGRVEHIDDIKTVMEDLFRDDGDEVVTLSSIHKAKGLECGTIWWLNPNIMPKVKTKSAHQQELNARYVATTRAKNALYYISLDGKKGKKVDRILSTLAEVNATVAKLTVGQVVDEENEVVRELEREMKELADDRNGDTRC